MSRAWLGFKVRKKVPIRALLSRLVTIWVEPRRPTSKCVLPPVLTGDTILHRVEHVNPQCLELIPPCCATKQSDHWTQAKLIMRAFRPAGDNIVAPRATGLRCSSRFTRLPWYAAGFSATTHDIIDQASRRSAKDRPDNRAGSPMCWSVSL